jgi:pyrroloquinoline-quinone synthase
MSAHPLRDTKAFRHELNAVLHEHLTLSHPIFLELFDLRRPDIELLRSVALQGYQLTKNFIGYIEQLYIG